jgi:hypothetical protein
MSSTQTTAPRAAATPPQRSWVARHKILSAAGVLLVILLVGFYFLGWPLVKLRFHPQYAAALELVTKSPEVIEKLGAPVEPVRPFPGGSAQDNGTNGTAQIYFAVQGPKGAGDVSVNSRMLQGQWDFSTVKLALPDHTEIDLLKGRQGDVGAFDPNAKATEVAPPNLPLNIDLNIPEIPQEPAKK